MKLTTTAFVLALSTLATSAMAAKSAPLEIKPIIDAGQPIDASTSGTAVIDKALATFQSQYADISGLFTAEDFRNPGEQKFIDQIDVDKPDVILAMASAKKKLDAMQASTRAENELEAVLVSPTQFPRIYEIAKHNAEVLGLSQNFHIFIKGASDINAYTYSYNPNDYDVVLYSALVDLLDDEGLMAVLGHEMGHVKDGAILWGTLMSASFEASNVSTPSAQHKPFYDSMFAELPQNLRSKIADAATALVAEKNVIMSASGSVDTSAFTRTCELTADRAGVIVDHKATGMLKVLAQLMYQSHTLASQINIDELVSQIRSVLTGDPDDFTTLLNNQPNHPYSPLRLVEASDFGSSKTFQVIDQRLTENSFGKELDLFVSIATKDADLTSRYKDYMDKKADTDETLVRLKMQDYYSTQIKHLNAGLKALGTQILSQVGGSGLSQPGDAVFDQFVAKAKDDQIGALKQLLAPAIADYVDSLTKTASAEQATELQAKAKALKDLMEVK